VKRLGCSAYLYRSINLNLKEGNEAEIDIRKRKRHWVGDVNEKKRKLNENMGGNV